VFLQELDHREWMKFFLLNCYIILNQFDSPEKLNGLICSIYLQFGLGKVLISKSGFETELVLTADFQLL
jgi:hypothetical protein